MKISLFDYDPEKPKKRSATLYAIIFFVLIILTVEIFKLLKPEDFEKVREPNTKNIFKVCFLISLMYIEIIGFIYFCIKRFKKKPIKKICKEGIVLYFLPGLLMFIIFGVFISHGMEDTLFIIPTAIFIFIMTIGYGIYKEFTTEKGD